MPDNILKGISFTGISQVLSMGLQFGVSVILARGLGSDQYGLYGVVQNAILTITAILDFGGSTTITKYIADYDAARDGQSAFSIFSTTLVSHSILSAFFLVIGMLVSKPVVSVWFDGDYILYGLFMLSVPVLLYINDFIALLYGLRELKYIAIRMIIQNGLLIIFNALMIWRLHLGVRIATGLYFVILILMMGMLLSLIVKLLNENRLVISQQFFFSKVIQFSISAGSLYMIDTVIRYAPVFLLKAFGVNNSSVNQEVASLSLALLLGSVVEGVMLIITKSGFGYVGRWQYQRKWDLVILYLFVMMVIILASYGLIFFISFIGIERFVGFVYGIEYVKVNSFIWFTLLVSMMRSLTILFRTLLYTIEMPRKALLASFIELIIYISAIVTLLNLGSIVDWGIELLKISSITGAIKSFILIFMLLKALQGNFHVRLWFSLRAGIEKMILIVKQRKFDVLQ